VIYRSACFGTQMRPHAAAGNRKGGSAFAVAVRGTAGSAVGGLHGRRISRFELVASRAVPTTVGCSLVESSKHGKGRVVGQGTTRMTSGTPSCRSLLT
jgi:hypothetical protein